jgi:CheY-like chemotaxis protein
MARILVMDDDSQIRGLVRTILEGDGHQATVSRAYGSFRTSRAIWS